MAGGLHKMKIKQSQLELLKLLARKWLSWTIDDEDEEEEEEEEE